MSARGCLSDEEVVSFVERTLDEAERAQAVSHVASCEACRSLVAELARASVPTSEASARRSMTEKAATLGRYVVLEILGRGAMGVVYAAYDPVLDRKVALKVLRDELGREPHSRERILREARGLAKLSHPNVVPIYDSGTVDGHVFFAMELVRGVTARHWSRVAKRSWRDVVDVYVQATSGLAAAHDAGLVHRDFKPDNVLVTDEGRAFVMDLGLVRLREESVASDPADLPLAQTVSDLTRSGTLLGTPAYMAPEQFGGDADARSDQFSLCVSLYEALYGQRPFDGRTVAEMLAAMARAGELVFPARPRVPARLRRAIRRGLAPDPRLRHPDMRALARELRPERRATRAVALLGAAAVFAAVAGPIAWARIARERHLCEDSGRELEGVWDDARARALAKSLAASGKPYAEDVVKTVTAALDSYAQQWRATRAESCVATRKRGDQSERLNDLRMACLDDRRTELGALVSTLATDPNVVGRAAQAALSLRPISSCGRSEVLARAEAMGGGPRSEAARALFSRLAEATALREAGKYRDALPIAIEVEQRAADLGEKAIRAQAFFVHGDVERALDRFAAASEHLEQSALLAESARDDETLARARAVRVYVLSLGLHRKDDAAEWARLARAAVDRLGGGDEIEGVLANQLGGVAYERGDYGEAERQYTQALERLTKALGADHPRVATAISNRAHALNELGRLDEAVAAQRVAIDTDVRVLGKSHPVTADKLNGLGAFLTTGGRPAEALEPYERALAIREAAFGPATAQVAYSLGNIGAALAQLDRYDEALGVQRRSLAMIEATRGPDDASAANSHNWIGLDLLALGRPAEALASFERAVSIREKALGPDHPEVAVALDSVALALLALEKCAEARASSERALGISRAALGGEHPDVAMNEQTLGEIALAVRDARGALVHFEKARAIYEKAYRPTHPYTIAALGGVGRARLELGEVADALTVLEGAWAAAEKATLHAHERATLSFALARALVANHADPERAQTLAERAIEGWRGPAHAAEAARARAFLNRLKTAGGR
jgi:tetratricopeptide (TPR) repeat protein/tRNA A-37 threonylcarbamoyl transferase component Bud32